MIFCPLMEEPCGKEKCEWWFVGGGCSIRAIADGLMRSDKTD